MRKVKISAGYDTPENLTERLIKQFKTPEIDLSEIEFVFDDSYDVIIFFNYINETIIEGKKSFVFPHEPSWNGAHQKSFSNETTVFGFSEELYSGNFIESIAHTYYGGRGPWVDTLDFWCYDNLINSTFNKNKIISSSITRLNSDFGFTCIYPQRYEILQNLRKNTSIDIFDGEISPKRKDALVDYKFNISIENSYENNWITEKFYDNILTNTIPIYFGCKNIRDIYPEDGYILIEDINDVKGIEKLISEIITNSDDIYNQKIKGLEQIKIKYFKEKNILNKIKNL
jgi:hypothetical protein